MNPVKKRLPRDEQTVNSVYQKRLRSPVAWVIFTAITRVQMSKDAESESFEELAGERLLVRIFDGMNKTE